MRKILELIIHEYENALVVRKYRLKRDEFIYLYLTAQGSHHLDLMDYLDCKKDKLYRLRANIVRKLRANNLNHALVIYAQIKTIPGSEKITL